MSISLDIVPFSDSLNMYGSPDPSSAYSLSGHVSISLKSSHSLFDSRRRAATFLLQSLELTFEGQTELISPKTGYTPVRLWSISRELAPSEPVEISNRGHEDSSEPCTWNVVFDLPIPGWLPATARFGHSTDAGTIYTLFATAKLVDLDGQSSVPYSFVCSPFRSKVKYAHAEKAVIVNRFVNPPDVDHSSRSLFPAITYGVDARPVGDPQTRDPARIPLDVLSKIQLLVSVPECISVDEKCVPCTLRLRATDLDSTECGRLQVTEFSMKLYQIEKYLPHSSDEYTARYPLPPKSSQPPVIPLRKPNGISTAYDMGLYYPHEGRTSSHSRQFSIIPTSESGIHVLADTHVFSPTDPATPPSWYSMETSIPIVQRQVAKEPQWAGHLKLRPSSTSPLFEVSHQIRLSLKCAYDIPGRETKATERLNFSLPLHFVRVTPAAPCSMHMSSSSLSSMSDTAPLLADDTPMKMAPSAQSLPAYSQLFDYNGDRKIDYSVQLPPYTPYLPVVAVTTSPPLDVGSACKSKALDCNVISDEGMLDADDRS